MKKVWHMWKNEEGIILLPMENVWEFKDKGLLDNHHFVDYFLAETHEEASSIFHLRNGMEPYIPMGKPQLCPNNCGFYYYPEGSGTCPKCGDIN